MAKLLASKTEQKILGFGLLESGWHYGTEGTEFEQGVLDRALALNEEAIRCGLFQTDAFPGTSGEVALAIYRNDTTLEFIVEPDGTMGFVQERGHFQVAYEEGLSMADAVSRIQRHSHCD